MSRIFWKTIAGHCIYQSADIQVLQNPIYRWLMFKDRIHLQTLIHRHSPHKPMLNYLKPFTLAVRTLAPGPVCLLGLGGGGVVHFIAQHIFPYPITAVEASLEVVDIAAQWFMLSQIAHLTTVHQYAEHYVLQNTCKYQHLLIDIYTAEGFPISCQDHHFFIHCKQLLTNTGFLALNLANFAQEIHLLTHLRDVFSQKTICIPIPTTTNMIILASVCDHAFQQLLQRTSFKTLIWDKQFGYMGRI
ncbi:MAG TPA: hypothetical protein VHD33_04110 [Legionellaceae bacterium]|nr:hypothetical protein [Legionellaceae bacterium]